MQITQLKIMEEIQYRCTSSCLFGDCEKPVAEEYRGESPFCGMGHRTQWKKQQKTYNLTTSWMESGEYRQRVKLYVVNQLDLPKEEKEEILRKLFFQCNGKLRNRHRRYQELRAIGYKNLPPTGKQEQLRCLKSVYSLGPQAKEFKPLPSGYHIDGGEVTEEEWKRYAIDSGAFVEITPPAAR